MTRLLRYAYSQVPSRKEPTMTERQKARLLSEHVFGFHRERNEQCPECMKPEWIKRKEREGLPPKVLLGMAL